MTESDEFPETVFSPAEYSAVMQGEKGNPFIEALPPVRCRREFAEGLTRYLPLPTDEDRAQPPEARIVALGQVYEFNQPTGRDVDLAMMIQTMIRNGYLERNPIGPNFSRRLLRGIAAEAAKKRGKRKPKKSKGLCFLGSPGVGKTAAIICIAECWPPGASHHEYPPGSGRMFRRDQIFVLLVSCTKSATLAGLLRKIIAAFDEFLGENYNEKAGVKRMLSTDLELLIGTLCEAHGVGLIVIDEIQHLRAGTEALQQQIVNFVTTLMNDWSVPVIFVATDWAAPLFTKAMTTTRRVGPGTILAQRASRADFGRFLKVIWKHQLVDVPVDYGESWLDLFYHLTCGIYDIAVKLFVAVQARALSYTGVSTITAKLVQDTWDLDFKLLHAHMKQIRAGRETDDPEFEALLKSIDPHGLKAARSREQEWERAHFEETEMEDAPDDDEQAAPEPTGTAARGRRTAADGKREGKPRKPGSPADGTVGEPRLAHIVREGKALGLSADEALRRASAKRRANGQA